MEANALSIPIAGYLETQNVPVILSRPHEVRYSELRNGFSETDRGFLDFHSLLKRLTRQS